MNATIFHHGTRTSVEPGDYRVRAYRYATSKEYSYTIILHQGQTHAILGMDPSWERVRYLGWR